MTDEHCKQWLNELKMGDEVVVEQPHEQMPYYMSKVIKITPKGGIRVKGFTSLLFKNGEAHADAYYWYRLLEPTDELLDNINLINMRRQLRAIDWNKVGDEIVRDVWDLTGR